MFFLLYKVVILLSIIMFVSGKMEPFVVGGVYSDIRQYPHSVLMIVDCLAPYLCGGSILTEHIVLTAAHCLYSCRSIPNFTILLKYGHEIPQYMESTMASKFVTHSRYDDTTLKNDIGMIYVDPAMEFSNNVKRVAILKRDPPRPRYAYVAGWGAVNAKGDTAPSLKHVRQTFPSREECEKLGLLTPATICAGGQYESEYPDQGDSGNALIVYDYIQIGIVSFKHPHYGLVGYTNTTYHYSWIMGTSKIISCA